MKKILLIVILISLSSTTNKLSAQTETSLIVNVYESVSDKAYNKIVVTEEDKLIEEIELVPFYYKDISNHQIEINKVLSQYREKGYKLISEMRGSLSAGTIMITTYRLEK